MKRENMKINKVKLNAITLAVGALSMSSAVLSGCGSNNEDVAAPVAPQQQQAAPVPQPTVTTTAVAPAPVQTTTPISFQDQCRAKMGTVMNINGQKACQTNSYWPSQYAAGGYSSYTFAGGFFPRLEANDASGYNAYSTGLTVKPHDRVTVQATGSWGSTSTTTTPILWGLVNVNTSVTSCNVVTVDGTTSSGLTVNQGMAAGLVGSDGSKVYLLGSSASVEIENEGTFKFGLNVPSTVVGGCANITITQLRVQHCELEDGSTVRCN